MDSNIVAEFLQASVGYSPSMPIVVALEVCDVFENHPFRLVIAGDFQNVVEESTLRCVLKPVLKSSFREWLTWKTSAENIMWWNFASRYVRDIASASHVEVALIEGTEFGVNLGGKYALVPQVA